MNSTILKIIPLLIFFSFSALAQVPESVYQESFSGESFPSGWKVNSSEKDLSWEVIKGVPSREGVSGSTMHFEVIRKQEKKNINIWAITPKVSMSPGVRYTISFEQQNLSNSGRASLQVILNSVQDYKESPYRIKTLVLEPRNGWIHHQYDITVETKGDYYLGFGITEFINDPNISIDEIKIEITANELKDFYNKSGADLSLLASWGANPDGNGSKPTSFGGAEQNFFITNYTSNSIPKLNSNWAVTGAGSKVILGDGSTPITLSVLDGKNLTAGKINVANHATLNVDASTCPSFGQLDPLSTIVFGKYAPADITEGVEFGSVVFNSGKKNKFSKKVKIKGKLDLLDAKLDLGDNDLELDYDASVVHGSEKNYIITSGTGRLRKGLKAGAEAFLPVGKNSYNPVKIKLASGSTDDVFSVSVIEGVFDNYINDIPNSLTPIVTSAVNKTWLISEDVKGGSDLTLTLTWSLADALTGFNPLSCHIKHYENGAWDSYLAGAATSNSLLATTFSVTRSGITSFSPYTVASTNNMMPMPVELLHFTAKASTNNTVNLNWATASEKDNDFFAVERSMDGKNFTEVARVKGAGSTSSRTNYTFTDNRPYSGTSYYRLKQVDFAGTFEYSSLQAVSLSSSQQIVLSVYPNPAQGKNVDLLVQGLEMSEEATVLVTDLTGKRIINQPLQEHAVTLATSNLKSGIYIVSLVSKSGTQTQKLVIR
ncbi:T9SS type A sorting domain-containing protein [Pontibacter harenae]|uniref:T9SS type A sorting domain-containing protein n=1 Tax=Pontibacter harenae TaxID=2894083 RepID=UPI001E342831|nr:T9SS type A sorting domain-containing protein [Pontibacter harenae]MCC9166748.1 T9SS type A sorting domain-containing protein [Pontibacter harenae]